tara:strand:+ start:386 stop:763 length:378 start_codon:yes stop_codon:yes gene_type:complete
MPYKDKEKQRKAQREYAVRNKAENLVRSNARKRKIRKWFEDLKADLQCSACPENHSACLEFHHVDENSKHGCVSSMVQGGYKISKIEKEIAKCIVLCSNCHRKLHYNNKTGSHTPKRHVRKNGMK